ncbi:MAG: DUF1049 domain-containing protein [Frankia sp.]|nr:DUF1049 domain-containing protein [Frankia sp.]
MTTPEQSMWKGATAHPSGPVPSPATPPVTVPTPGGPAGPATQAGPEAGRRRGVSPVLYAATVVVLLLAILVILFVVKNDQQVNVWLFGSTRRMSVAAALSMSAGAGLVVGLLLGLVGHISLRRRWNARRQARRD